MKRTGIIFALMWLTISTLAQHLTEREALDRALQYLNGTAIKARYRIDTDGARMRAVKVDGEHIYAFNREGGGFVIASADERTLPVLGYSEGGAVDSDNMPANMRAWLRGYNDQMEYLNRQPVAAAARHTVVGEEIAPLLTTKWDQFPPYNHLCPLDGTVHSLTGCVATAMAQVMNYWKYPAATVNPIPGYTTDELGIVMPGIPAGTPIDWNNMVNIYEGYETDEQQEAVAHLMAICGTAVEMTYTGSASAASSLLVAAALRTYFDYDDALTLEDRDDYLEAEWNQRVYDELKAERPVYYAGTSVGGGHAFVVDGYGGNDYFHINWGWNGNSNGYFLLSVLNPQNNEGAGASWSNDGYSFWQYAIFGVQPNTGADHPVAPVLVADEAAILGESEMTRADMGEDFHVRVGFSQYNHHESTYTFDMGVGLFDTDGQLLEAFYGATRELPYQYGVSIGEKEGVELSFGKNLDDGTFIIKSISRLAGTETWYADRGADIHCVRAVIRGNTLTLSPPVFNLTGTLVVEGKKEVGSVIPITAAITNHGTPWKGVVFLLQNGKAVGGTHIDLLSGETKDAQFSILPETAEKLELSVIARGYNPSTGFFEYTVFITDSIDVGYASFANLTFAYEVTNAPYHTAKENALKLKLTATNNDSSTYENAIKVTLFKDGHNGLMYSLMTRKQNVRIENGNQVDVFFEFENLDDDNYVFWFSYLSGGEWEVKPSLWYTVQSHEPEPVPELSTTGKTLNAVEGNDIPILKSDTAMVSVHVENIGTLDYDDIIIVRLYEQGNETSGVFAAVETPIQLAVGADTTFVVQIPGLKDGGTYYYWIYYKENRKEVVGPQSTPLFTVKLENPTAIRGVDDRKSTNDDAIYDLQGRKVMTHSSFLTPHLKKGLYIHHGKKYMK